MSEPDSVEAAAARVEAAYHQAGWGLVVFGVVQVTLVLAFTIHAIREALQ